jgi:glucuronate isomerase
MSTPLILHEDRLFSAEPAARGVARELCGEVKGLPILSPHGHTDPEWFATNAPFGSAAELFLQPYHYLYRMLYSQGVSLEAERRNRRQLFRRHRRRPLTLASPPGRC